MGDGGLNMWAKEGSQGRFAPIGIPEKLPWSTSTTRSGVEGRAEGWGGWWMKEEKAPNLERKQNIWMRPQRPICPLSQPSPGPTFVTLLIAVSNVNRKGEAELQPTLFPHPNTFPY